MQAVCPSGENFVDDEGTLPLGLEFVLFLLQQAQNEFADVVSFGPHLSALIPASLMLIKCGTGFCNVALLLQGILTVLPIKLGLSLSSYMRTRGES